MKKRILLNDVALRESAQVQGGAMSPRDQASYVRHLVDGGIDRMEIGFPGSSPEQFEQCRRIIAFVDGLQAKQRPLLGGLARARQEDILAVKEAGCDTCHIYIPASPEFVNAMFSAEKYGDSLAGRQAWVLDQTAAMVSFAKSLGFAQIEYSPEDAARTSLEFLVRVVETAAAAGADVVNIPDTTGLRIGDEFGCLIAFIKEHAKLGKAMISVHCHNDSDHSTHNALQAILSGADIVEGTFYGLGERSGMTKLESILMNFSSRPDIFGGYDTGFDCSRCVAIVNFVAHALGMPVPRHWVVAGAQNALCSSGTHQAIEARAKESGQGSAYYSWRPELFGHCQVQTVITASSGRAGLKKRLEALGYELADDELQKVYDRVTKVSEAKTGQALSDREIVAVVQDVFEDIPFAISVIACQAIGGRGTIPSAVASISSHDGGTVRVSAAGDGPIDAVMRCVVEAASSFYPVLRGLSISLDDWRPRGVTSGTDSLADVYVRIRVSNGEDRVFAARAVDLDTIQASAQAFANCLSWLLASLEH
jgi:2-isopropylmalate synthase